MELTAYPFRRQTAGIRNIGRREYREKGVGNYGVKCSQPKKGFGMNCERTEGFTSLCCREFCIHSYWDT